MTSLFNVFVNVEMQPTNDDRGHPLPDLGEIAGEIEEIEIGAVADLSVTIAAVHVVAAVTAATMGARDVTREEGVVEVPVVVQWEVRVADPVHRNPVDHEENLSVLPAVKENPPTPMSGTSW